MRTHKKLTQFIILLMLHSSLAIADGVNGVGNGGDTITCVKSNDNLLNGTYSLDYLLTLSNVNNDNDTTEVTSWQSSSDRIYKILQDKIPTIADLFEDYRKQVFNTIDYSKKRIWEPTPFGLMDIKDEFITEQIPKNCLTEGKTKVTQTAIRQFETFSKTKDHIIYKYVPDIVNELNKKSPLQLSFLLVHEWLWDLSPNVDRNRRINHFLHSKKIEQLSPNEVQEYLKGMGLYIPGVESNIFLRSSCQGRKLTAEDIYAQKDKINIFGKIKHFLRKRQLRLNEPSTEGDWLRNDELPDLFNDNKFFAYSIKQDNPNFKELINIHSTIWSGNNSWKTIGQISCNFINDEAFNLNCTVNNTLPIKLVKLKGLITEECLRLESEYYKNEYTEEIHNILSFFDYQIQSVLFLNYKWKK